MAHGPYKQLSGDDGSESEQRLRNTRQGPQIRQSNKKLIDTKQLKVDLHTAPADERTARLRPEAARALSEASAPLWCQAKGV